MDGGEVFNNSLLSREVEREDFFENVLGKKVFMKVHFQTHNFLFEYFTNNNSDFTHYFFRVMCLQLLTEGPGVEVWRRCGYCDGGKAGVERLGRWNKAKLSLPGHLSLFRGIKDHAIVSLNF